MLKNKVSTTIAIGQTTTGAILCNEYAMTGVVFTGSVVTGSQVSFLVSSDGANYYSLFNYSGTEVTIPVSGCTRAYNLDYQIFKPWNYFKLRLGYSGSSVAQATYPLDLDFLLTQE